MFKINIYQPLGLTHTLFNPLNNPSYQKSGFAVSKLIGNTRNGTINFPNVRTHVIQGQVHDAKSFHSLNGASGHFLLLIQSTQSALFSLNDVNN
jgi:hypothetical protein